MPTHIFQYVTTWNATFVLKVRLSKCCWDSPLTFPLKPIACWVMSPGYKTHTYDTKKAHHLFCSFMPSTFARIPAAQFLTIWKFLILFAYWLWILRHKCCQSFCAYSRLCRDKETLCYTRNGFSCSSLCLLVLCLPFTPAWQRKEHCFSSTVVFYAHYEALWAVFRWQEGDRDSAAP